MSTLAAALIAKKAKPLPKGWETFEQICKAEGKSPNHTRVIIRAAINAGLLESQQWPLPMSNGITRAVPIYRRVKP